VNIASPGIFISKPPACYAFFFRSAAIITHGYSAAVTHCPCRGKDYGLRISARYYRSGKGANVDGSRGDWPLVNEEVKDNLALLDEVEQAARTVKGSERSWQRAGHEYTLWLDGEEVMIRANQLEFSAMKSRGDELLRRRKPLCAALRISCRWLPPIVSLCSSVDDCAGLRKP
jgi:hypothetical protein